MNPPSSLVDANSMPSFNAGQSHGPVRSFCRGAWGGLKDGTWKVDSTNRPNGLFPVRKLDQQVLEQALVLLLERHSVLNCYVETRDDQPWLVPRPASRPSLTVLPFQGASDADHDAVEATIGALVWAPLDVWNGPLYRAYAVQRGQGEGYVGFVSHHFVSDARSIQILMRDLRQLYEALISNRRPALPPVGLRYQDYLHAINLWIGSDAGLQMRSEVLERLKRSGSTDFARTLDRDNAEEETFCLDRAVSENVRKEARALGVTPFTILLAAQKALLRPYSSSDDVTIKIITTGREITPLMQVVGNMADRFYVVTDLAGTPPFAEIVSRTQESLSWSRKRAYLRDDFVQSDLGESGVSSAAPVFNFRTIQGGSPPSIASPQRVTCTLKVPPPPSMIQTRPRDAYYLVIMDNGTDMWGSVRYGAGRIRNLLSGFVRVLSTGSTNGP